MLNNAKHPSFCQKKETAEEREKASDVREFEDEKERVRVREISGANEEIRARV